MLSPRWRRDFQLFAIVCVSVISTQIVTGDINYDDLRHDEFSAVRPHRARTSRQILEKILEQTGYKNIYSLQEATEHLLRYGALLRIHFLETFGALVYDYYDDFSIGQTEALYKVYEDTLQRKYNIFDIVPSILKNQDTRPTTICQYIHKYVSTCLRESSYLCGTIKNHNLANPEASAIKMANITRHVFQRGNIIDYYSLGFSMPDVLEHLKAGRLNLTVDLLAGLLQNVQYDTFDNDVLRAERNVVAVLVEEQPSLRSLGRQRGVKVSEEEIRKAQDIPYLLKRVLDRNKVDYEDSISRDFALLAEHVVREVEAISRNIEVFGIVYDNGSIDVDYLFDLVLPPDVVDSDVTAAKNYLLREMKDHEILEKYLKVDKYAQSGPDDLLMEILDQLKDMNFADDLATALRAHARFWHRSHMISDLHELLELFEAYENLRRVSRYNDMIKAMDEVRSELRNSKNVSVEILCNNPRACLRLGLEIVSKCAYVLPKTRETVEKFFQYLSRDGSVRVDNCDEAVEPSNDGALEVTEKPQTTLTTASDDSGNRRTISREPTTRSFRGHEQIDEVLLTRQPVTLILPNSPEEIFPEESDETTTVSSTEDDAGQSNIDTMSKGRDRKKPLLMTTTESSTEEISGDEFPDESDYVIMGDMKSRKLSVTPSEGEEATTTMKSEENSTSTTNESTTEDRTTSTTEISTTLEPEISKTVVLLKSGTTPIEELPTNDQTATVVRNLSSSENNSLSTTEVITEGQRETTEKSYLSGRSRELANAVIGSTTVPRATTDKKTVPGNETEPLATEERATTTEQPTPTGGNDSPTSTTDDARTTTTRVMTSSDSGNHSASTILELTTEGGLTTENAVVRSNGEGSTSDHGITESTTKTEATTRKNDLTTDATTFESTTEHVSVEVEVTTQKVNYRAGGKLLKSKIRVEVPRGNGATTGGELKVDNVLTRRSTPLIVTEQQTTERMPLLESDTKMASNVDAKLRENCSDTDCNPTKCVGGKCSSDHENVDASDCSEQLCAKSSVECKDVDVNCSDDSVEDSSIPCLGKNCTVEKSANLRLPNIANDTSCVETNCDELGKASTTVVPCNIKDPHHRRKIHRLEKVRVISSLHSVDRSLDHAGEAVPSSSTQFYDEHYNEAEAAVATNNKLVSSIKNPVPPKAENLKAENQDEPLHTAAATSSSIRRYPTLVQEPVYLEEVGPIDIPYIPDPDDYIRRAEHKHRAKDSGAKVDWDVVPAKWMYAANRNAMGRSPTEKVAKNLHRRKMSAPPKVRLAATWKNQGQNGPTGNLPPPKNGTVHPVQKKAIIYENYDEYFPHGREDRSIIRAPRRMGRRFRAL